jgi:hypothetical protein
MKLTIFLWERHLMAAVAFGEGRLPRLSWLDLPAEASAQAGATPTKTIPHHH